MTFTVESVVGSPGTEGGQPSPAALQSFFSTNLDQTGTDNNTGKAAWTFTAADSAFDYLGVGETLVVTYRVAVSDGIAPAITRDVVVTITGVNDTVAISAETAAISDTSGNDVLGPIDGAFDISDLDVTDNHTFSVTGEAVDLTVDGFDRSVSHALGTLYFNSDTGAYRFVPNEAAIEALKAAPIPVVFNLTVNDNNGSTATNTFTINIDATNDAADINGDIAGAVVEAGGVNNATPGTSASGNLNYTDRDDTADVWNTTVVTNGQYGTLTIDANGVWSYALDNDNATVQGLKTSGDIQQDIITVATSDGTQQQITITITGQNDAAVILGTSVSTGTVTEAGGVNNATNPTPTASGDVNHTDVDTADAEDAWTPATISGTYGSLTINAAGEWTYTLDNDRPAVKALDTGAPVTDTITVFTTGGTAHNIVIAVNGSNDAPVVGAINAPDHLNEVNGLQALNATGSFTVTDEDGSDTLTPSVTAATLTYSGGEANIPSGLADLLADLDNVSFSTLNNNSNGGAPVAFNWTYGVAGAALDFLRAGETLTITYTMQVSDGDASHTQPLVITITGTNDVPTIAGGTIGSGVVEAVRPLRGYALGVRQFVWRRGRELDRSRPHRGRRPGRDQGSFGASSQAVLVFDGSASGAQPGEAAINGTYGTLFLKADGTYRYVLDNTHPATQALDQGDTPTETFNYTIANNGGGAANEATSTLTIDITGANDGPTGISTATGIANYADITNDTKAIGFAGLTIQGPLTIRIPASVNLSCPTWMRMPYSVFGMQQQRNLRCRGRDCNPAAATFVWSNGTTELGRSTGLTANSPSSSVVTNRPDDDTIPTTTGNLTIDDRADILNAFDITGASFNTVTNVLTVDCLSTLSSRWYWHRWCRRITIDNNTSSANMPTSVGTVSVNFLAAGETLTVTFPVVSPTNTAQPTPSTCPSFSPARTTCRRLPRTGRSS